MEEINLSWGIQGNHRRVVTFDLIRWWGVGQRRRKMEETLKGHSECKRQSQLIFTFEVMTAEGIQSHEKLLLIR